MSDTDPPPTLPQNETPEDVDIGTVVVRNIVREEMQPVKEHVTDTADRVLSAIQEVGEQVTWMVVAVKENRRDIDRILDHLGLNKGEDNGAAPTQ